jgi:hydroxymethylpyrimidine/phosphomethylpyrimidine kinase
LHAAVGEALAFMDQSLDAGFRPGMGSVLPDRFFWALPPAQEGEPPAGAATADDEPAPEPSEAKGKPAQRRIH